MMERRKLLKTLGYNIPAMAIPASISLHYVNQAKSKGVYNSFASRFISYFFILTLAVFLAVVTDVVWKVPTETVTIAFIVVVGFLTFITPSITKQVEGSNKRKDIQSFGDISEYLAQFKQIEILQTQVQQTLRVLEGDVIEKRRAIIEVMSNTLLSNLMNEGEHQRRRRSSSHPSPIHPVGSTSPENLIAQQETLKKLLSGKSTRVAQ